MGNNEKRKIIQEELEALAPKLARLKEMEKPVDIPVDYFDQLPMAVFQRIRETQPMAKPGLAERWQWLWQRWTAVFSQPTYVMALAGIAVIVIGLSILLRKNDDRIRTEVAMSDEDINSYIDYHIDDFDLGLLMEAAAFSPSETELFPVVDSLDEKGMEEYFDELLDDIDLEELL